MKKLFIVLWTGILLSTSSCSTMIQFNTQKAADPRFNGIRTIGVNTVVLTDNQNLDLNDNLGRWKVKNTKVSIEKLDTLVRKSLVANLKKFSDYEVIDLQDLRKFQGTFQRLRPLSGERIGELDLVIDIRLSSYSQQQYGNIQEVMTFRKQRTAKRGKKWIQVEDSSTEKVVTVPYSNSRVDITCYVEVIKTKNGEARVLKSFNTSLTNSSDPMTSIQTMINEMGIMISGRILKDVSRYALITKRKIDKDSEDKVVELLEGAKLNAAASRLESILTKSGEREPADLYNLGICYEAFGDPALAIQMYHEAHNLDKDNELYLKAIGELE